MYIGLGILEMNNDDMHHAYVLKPFLLVFNNIFMIEMINPFNVGPIS